MCVYLVGVSLVVGWHPVTLVVLAVLLATLAIFPFMTVEVDGRTFSIAFGRGLARTAWPIDELHAWRAVRNPWWYGWGIHYIPGGWLYNVSGSCAVEIELAGGRRARIGTDDPAGLVAALDRAAVGKVRGEVTAAASDRRSGT